MNPTAAFPRFFRRFAPLAALMLAAFTMAGCINNPRLAKERDALYSQNQELQQELDRARAALDASERDRPDLRARIARLQKQLDAKPTPPPAQSNGFSGIAGVQTFQGNGMVTVRVPGDVLFAAGKAKLRDSSKKTLKQIAQVIQNQYAGDTVRIEGYTDTDPIRKSKWNDNLDLSLERAAAVHRYLQQEGVSPDRMYAAGFGETHAQSTKAQSRRVQIVVVKK